MEILRFDSRQPNVKFSPLIERLREKMANVEVLVRPGRVAALESYASFHEPQGWAVGRANEPRFAAGR
jgi:hypothetical protein